MLKNEHLCACSKLGTARACVSGSDRKKSVSVDEIAYNARTETNAGTREKVQERNNKHVLTLHAQKDYKDSNFRKIDFNRSTKARSSIKHLYFIVAISENETKQVPIEKAHRSKLETASFCGRLPKLKCIFFSTDLTIRIIVVII